MIGPPLINRDGDPNNGNANPGMSTTVRPAAVTSMSLRICSVRKAQIFRPSCLVLFPAPCSGSRAILRAINARTPVPVSNIFVG